MVLSRALKRSTKDAPGSTNSNGLDTAITITEGASSHSADESAQVVDGNLLVSVKDRRPVELFERERLTIPP